MSELSIKISAHLIILFLIAVVAVLTSIEPSKLAAWAALFLGITNYVNRLIDQAYAQAALNYLKENSNDK